MKFCKWPHTTTHKHILTLIYTHNHSIHLLILILTFIHIHIFGLIHTCAYIVYVYLWVPYVPHHVCDFLILSINVDIGNCCYCYCYCKWNETVSFAKCATTTTKKKKMAHKNGTHKLQKLQQKKKKKPINIKRYLGRSINMRMCRDLYFAINGGQSRLYETLCNRICFGLNH